MLPQHKIEISKIDDTWFCSLLEITKPQEKQVLNIYKKIDTVEAKGYLELMRLAAEKGFISVINY